jgi:hypothetical protein
LFWSILGLIGFYILQILPQTNRFFTNKLIRDYSINEILSTVFINPIPYQLWFVKALMIMTILSPVIYFLIRYLRFISVLLFGVTWFLGFDFIVVSNDALFFFVFGAFLCINEKKLEELEFQMKSWIFTLFWIVIVFCKTILIYIKFPNTIIITALQDVGILIGMLAIWTLYDSLFLNKELNSLKFYPIFSFSFFIYVSHEPTLTIVKKTLFYIMGKGEFISLFVYVIAPLLTIIFSLFIGCFLKLVTPKLYEIITGGR